MINKLFEGVGELLQRLVLLEDQEARASPV
jgi:hypothetical protein